jgi:hypothetical protein
MPKKYEYLHAETCQSGNMICATCHEPIQSGRYRLRETRHAFYLQHETCCSDDPEWRRLDEERKKLIAKEEAFRNDLLVLMRKHKSTSSESFVWSAIAALDLHDEFQ